LQDSVDISGHDSAAVGFRQHLFAFASKAHADVMAHEICRRTGIRKVFGDSVDYQQMMSVESMLAPLPPSTAEPSKAENIEYFEHVL
jgi:hypothetical protein